MKGAWALGAVCAALSLGACHDAERRAAERWPLPSFRVPSLRCFDPPVQHGDCARQDDCGAGQLCRLDASAPAPDRGPVTLSCGAALGTQPARAACATGSECESGLCALAGVCLQPCAHDDDCSMGQSCQPVEARLAQDALAPVMACARSTAFSSDVKLAHQAPLRLEPGRINELTLEVEAADALVLLKVACGAALRVQRIVEADTGAVVFDAEAQLNGVIQRNPTQAHGPLVPLLLPNNPRVQLSRARYTLGLTIDRESELSVLTASRSAAHDQLELNVFYVGGGSELAEGGVHPGDPAFAAVLAGLAERFKSVGIDVRAIHEFDVVGALRQQLADLPVDEELANADSLGGAIPGLAALSGLSAGLDQGGIDVMVVSTAGPLLGFAPSIPGALGTHGSAASNVILALDTAGLAQAERTLFHELGHHLGLFHTTERDGSSIEPLADTAVCGPARDQDGDGVLRPAECGAHGADNVMFWDPRGDQLSSEQRALLRRSLALD